MRKMKMNKYLEEVQILLQLEKVFKRKNNNSISSNNRNNKNKLNRKN